MHKEAKESLLKVIYELSESQIAELHAVYQHEWWTKGRTLADTKKCVESSQVCVGLVDHEEALVGFCRVLTDFVYKALIFDVIIASRHRGHGLGDRLVSLVLNHTKLAGVRSFELYCRPELVPFYERHGFGDDVGEIKLMRRSVVQPGA